MVRPTEKTHTSRHRRLDAATTAVVEVAGALDQQQLAARRWREFIHLGTRNVGYGPARGEIPADREAGVASAFINGVLRYGPQHALSLPDPPTLQRLFHDIWAFIEGGMSAPGVAASPGHRQR